MQLTEKYRPSRLSHVIGQESTVSALQTLLARGMHSSAIYLTGPSGTGKTTIGRALIAEIGVHADDITTIPGADVTADFIRELRGTFQLSTWGESGWKACLVDEAHGMSKQAVQLLLPYLESLPSKRLFVLTSTESLAGDMFGNFTSPLASRCKVFELSADVSAMAEHAAGIANDENLNGQPLEAYEALLASCQGNLRAALQKIEAGFMLTPHTEKPKCVSHAVPPMQSMPSGAATQGTKVSLSSVGTSGSKSPAASPHSKTCRISVTASKDDKIAVELETGKKFFAGSKKHKLHLARLAALRAN